MSVLSLLLIVCSSPEATLLFVLSLSNEMVARADVSVCRTVACPRVVCSRLFSGLSPTEGSSERVEEREVSAPGDLGASGFELNDTERENL